jgi:hypothetical protein
MKREKESILLIYMQKIKKKKKERENKKLRRSRGLFEVKSSDLREKVWCLCDFPPSIAF